MQTFKAEITAPKECVKCGEIVNFPDQDKHECAGPVVCHGGKI